MSWRAKLITHSLIWILTFSIYSGSSAQTNDPGKYNYLFFRHQYFDGFKNENSIIPYADIQPALSLRNFYPENVKKNRIKRIISFEDDTTLENLKNKFLFDTNGHFLTSESKNEFQVFYNQNHHPDSVILGDTLPTLKYTYDSLGNLIHLKFSEEHYYQWKYENNLLVEVITQRNKEDYGKYGLEYNSDSTLKNILLYEDELITDRWEYNYDSSGRIIKINYYYFDELHQFETINYYDNKIEKLTEYPNSKLKKRFEARLDEKGTITYYRQYRTKHRKIFLNGRDYIKWYKQKNIYDDHKFAGVKTKIKYKGKLFRTKNYFKIEYLNNLPYKTVFKTGLKKTTTFYQYEFYTP